MTMPWMTKMSGSAISEIKTRGQVLPRVYASLRLKGDRLDPDKVSRVLGLEPTLAYRKGDVYRRQGDREARGRTNLWLYTTRGQIDSAELEEHLKLLLLRMEGNQEHRRPLVALVAKAEADAEVICFWYGPPGSHPPVIGSDLRETFERAGARIETDFYVGETPPSTRDSG